MVDSDITIRHEDEEKYLDEEALWEEWREEHKEELDKIAALREEGHTHHCACRIVWGDNCCTCRLQENRDGC
jgi:hypothetical protein